MDFVHCTMANFYPWKSRQGVAVNIANNLAEEANTAYPLLGVNFINCIITGSKSDELTTNIIENTGTEDWSEYTKFTFKNSLINSWKSAIEPNEQHFSNIVWENKDNTAYGPSNFRTIDDENFIYDFHLDALSVARGIGTNDYPNPLPYDKDEQARTTEVIDAGCYLYVE